ncbi:reverse transcriptase domain-containing protein [Tanacetum coccineum]
MHAGARSVVAKIIRQGYYWLAMYQDAKEDVDKCDSCQIHAPVPRLPKTQLTSIMSPWPFYQWGLDILGPLLKGLGKLKFKIVAIDYFTKWMEAKPLAKTTGKEAHYTMLKTSNGETPFSLTYGSEEIIPAKIGMPTYQMLLFNKAQNEEEMRLNVDLIQ